MADQDKISSMPEDITARKTVRLSAIQPATDNTDTGSMDIINDTQTRKTVKLQPLTESPNAPAAAPMQAAPSDDDTSTRKAPVLKPKTPAGQIPGMDSVASASTMKLTPPVAPMQAAPSADDTSTRKAPVLKPKAPAQAAPAQAAPAPAAPEAPAAQSEDENRTVRIQRPSRPASAVTPASASTMKLTPPTPAAPAQAAPAQAAPAPAKPAVPAPAAPAPAAPAPAKPAVPAPAKPAVPAPAKPAVPAPAPAPAAKKAAGDDIEVKVNQAPAAPAPAKKAPPKKGGKDAKDDAPKASGFYTVLALLTLIIVLAGTVMTALHYVKFEHKLDYSHLVPGLPQAK